MRVSERVTEDRQTLALLANVSGPPNPSLSLLVKKRDGHLGVELIYTPVLLLQLSLGGMDSVVKLGAYCAAHLRHLFIITEGKTGAI